jgi:chemotaxis signal transduction protein
MSGTKPSIPKGTNDLGQYAATTRTDLLEQIRTLENKLVSLKRELIQIGPKHNERSANGDRLRYTLFSVRERLIAIPISDVEQVEQMPGVSRLAQPDSVVIGLVDYHGAQLAVIDLAALLGLSPGIVSADKVLIICCAMSLRFALMVDEVADVVTVSSDRIRIADEVMAGSFRSNGFIHTSDKTAAILDGYAIALSAQLNDIHPIDPHR